MAVVLVLIFLKPKGLIDYEQFGSKILLIAEREGVVNCRTIIKLKANNTFVEKSYCFGIEQTEGEYSIKNDTIFFSNLNRSSSGKDYFEFATIKKSEFSDQMCLVRFQNQADSLGKPLFLVKNELIEID